MAYAGPLQVRTQPDGCRPFLDVGGKKPLPLLEFTKMGQSLVRNGPKGIGTGSGVKFEAI